jgi:peptidoglycan LD-endopeptidase LytH
MKWIKRLLLFTITLLVIGYLLPQPYSMPVKGASINSYNQQSFWAYQWGTSITHKGVDIFAKEGADVLAPTYGIILFTGKLSKGGNAIVMLGPKWRFHYFAHLRHINTSSFTLVKSNTTIGTVGTTGNAKGKAPHLHYTIKSIIPLPWNADKSIQGWKKMFYINPIPFLNKSVH